MKHTIKLWIVALTALCVSPAAAQQLGPGDPAPKFEVSRFAKGKPIQSLAKGNLYVVEFWATWCGPCRQTIPHLTKLQKQYPAVTFVGVSVLEQDPSAVGPFVKEMGSQMDYRVALDLVPKGKNPQEGKMARNWMTAAGQSGIPAAFIVDKQGRIAWIGHPAQMEEPLAKVVQGKWNVQAEAAKHAKEQKAQRIIQVLQQKLAAAEKAKSPKQAYTAVQAALTADPSLEPMLGMHKFQFLLDQGGTTAQALAYGNRLIDTVYATNPQALNQFAWGMVAPGSPQRPPAVRKLALKTALKADKLTNGKVAEIADTLARTYFANGDTPKAIATQERAVKLGKGKKEAQTLEKSLAEYRKAARGGK